MRDVCGGYAAAVVEIVCDGDDRDGRQLRGVVTVGELVEMAGRVEVAPVPDTKSGGHDAH